MVFCVSVTSLCGLVTSSGAVLVSRVTGGKRHQCYYHGERGSGRLTGVMGETVVIHPVTQCGRRGVVVVASGVEQADNDNGFVMIMMALIVPGLPRLDG